MIAHATRSTPERAIRESALGSTKPPSSYQLDKLRIGRKRAAMSGKGKRADKRLRRF